MGGGCRRCRGCPSTRVTPTRTPACLDRDKFLPPCLCSPSDVSASTAFQRSCPTVSSTLRRGVETIRRWWSSRWRWWRWPERRRWTWSILRTLVDGEVLRFVLASPEQAGYVKTSLSTVCCFGCSRPLYKNSLQRSRRFSIHTLCIVGRKYLYSVTRDRKRSDTGYTPQFTERIFL